MSDSPELILASGSPRRKDLLEGAGFTFRVVKPEVEENEDVTCPIRELTAENALLKARAVSESERDAVVIAADTLVLLGDRVLTKPSDRAEARKMISALNGRSHQVFTAVAIEHVEGGRERLLTVTTNVHFKSLSDEELAAYHEKINPMDKAGAYAAQEHGELIIDHIEGSMTNVIGLPMDEVIATLAADFGVIP
ncbi:MAG: Maf family protein [Verrucomicrobiota bacterium]